MKVSLHFYTYLNIKRTPSITTDRPHITKILLKVALNTIEPTNQNQLPRTQYAVLKHVARRFVWSR